MTDSIFIVLGLTTVALMFVRHQLLLKRIRQIESDIDSTRTLLERVDSYSATRTQSMLMQIEELKRRCR